MAKITNDHATNQLKVGTDGTSVTILNPDEFTVVGDNADVSLQLGDVAPAGPLLPPVG